MHQSVHVLLLLLVRLPLCVLAPTSYGVHMAFAASVGWRSPQASPQCINPFIWRSPQASVGRTILPWYSDCEYIVIFSTHSCINPFMSFSSSSFACLSVSWLLLRMAFIWRSPQASVGVRRKRRRNASIRSYGVRRKRRLEELYYRGTPTANTL